MGQCNYRPLIREVWQAKRDHLIGKPYSGVCLIGSILWIGNPRPLGRGGCQQEEIKRDEKGCIAIHQNRNNRCPQNSNTASTDSARLGAARPGGVGRGWARQGEVTNHNKGDSMSSQKLGVVKMEMERLSTRIAEFEMCHGPRESGAVKRSVKGNQWLTWHQRKSTGGLLRG